MDSASGCRKFFLDCFPLRFARGRNDGGYLRRGGFARGQNDGVESDCKLRDAYLTRPASHAPFSPTPASLRAAESRAAIHDGCRIRAERFWAALPNTALFFLDCFPPRFARGRNDAGGGKGSTSNRYKNTGKRIQAREYRQENTGKRIQAREYRQKNIGMRICDSARRNIDLSRAVLYKERSGRHFRLFQRRVFAA